MTEDQLMHACDHPGVAEAALTTAGTADAPTADRRGRRLAVLQAAANFLGLWGQAREEVRSEHVLVLAARWLAWVEQDDRAATPPSAGRAGASSFGMASLCVSWTSSAVTAR